MNAARDIRSRYKDQLPDITASIRINQVITDVPFGEGTLHAYLDTSGGSMEFELGEIDAKELATFPVGDPEDGIALRVGKYGPYLEGPDDDGAPAAGVDRGWGRRGRRGACRDRGWLRCRARA